MRMMRDMIAELNLFESGIVSGSASCKCYCLEVNNNLKFRAVFVGVAAGLPLWALQVPCAYRCTHQMNMIPLVCGEVPECWTAGV